MNRLKHTRSSLFLIELIIAVLFFSVGSAVCIRVFAQAALLSREAGDLSFASAQVSGAASAARYTDGSAAALAEYFPSAAETAEGCAIYFDEERQPCEAEAASYILTIHTERDGLRAEAHLAMTGPDGGTLYELDLRYPAEDVPAAAAEEKED